jgi:hypothetical protein
MSDADPNADANVGQTPNLGQTPKEPPPPPNGLGVLFLAAALALALVLSLVALIAYMAFSPQPTVNPPPHGPSAKPAPEGGLRRSDAARDRRT